MWQPYKYIDSRNDNDIVIEVEIIDNDIKFTHIDLDEDIYIDIDLNEDIYLDIDFINL